MEIKSKINIVLVGNPNTGKTSIFNNILKTNYFVANYSGATVEHKLGKIVYENIEINIVDLPGIYNLEGYSLDENITKNYILDNYENIDLIVNILNATNLERNFFLSIQLFELNLPMVFVLNMFDEAQNLGIDIDIKKMINLLDSPVIPSIALKNIGTDEILKSILDLTSNQNKAIPQKPKVSYGEDIEKSLNEIYSVIPEDEFLLIKYPKDFLLINLLRKNEKFLDMLNKSDYFDKLLFYIDKNKDALEKKYQNEIEKANINLIISDKIYGLSKGIFSEIVTKKPINRFDLSDKIDNIVLNRFLEYPILIFVSYFVFKFTFSLSAPFTKIIEIIFTKLTLIVSGFLQNLPILKSLVIDGIFAGIGNLLGLVPIIFFLFFIMAILESIGYMPRIIFVMDKFMHKIGLHGRSFIPMILGFGCNVPAIMATRTIKSSNERMVSILINPFMSCGARLPVYLLFISTFFSVHERAWVLFGLYLTGIIVAIITSKILRKFIFNKDVEDFVMELPPYRMFSLKNVYLYSYQRVKIYLKKLGTVILFGSIIFWSLSNLPTAKTVTQNKSSSISQSSQISNNNIENSYSAKIGKALVPIFKPIGLEDWRICVSFISGVFAKEMVVSTLSTLYAVTDSGNISNFRDKLDKIKKLDGKPQYNKLTALIIMLFVLLYFPCLGALTAIKKETDSWFWASFSLVYGFAVAWIICFFIYHIFSIFV
jgi:ferrous iron transport protein B